MTSTITISIQFGADCEVATIRESNRSTPVVVDVLGVEFDPTGSPKVVYLRSKIHTLKSEPVTYRGWEPSGAISTILTRID